MGSKVGLGASSMVVTGTAEALIAGKLALRSTMPGAAKVVEAKASRKRLRSAMVGFVLGIVSGAKNDLSNECGRVDHDDPSISITIG